MKECWDLTKFRVFINNDHVTGHIYEFELMVKIAIELWSRVRVWIKSRLHFLFFGFEPVECFCFYRFLLDEMKSTKIIVFGEIFCIFLRLGIHLCVCERGKSMHHCFNMFYRPLPNRVISSAHFIVSCAYNTHFYMAWNIIRSLRCIHYSLGLHSLFCLFSFLFFIFASIERV